MKSFPPPNLGNAPPSRPSRPPGYGAPQSGYRAPQGSFESPGYQAPRDQYRAPGTTAPPRAVGNPGGGGGSTAFALRGVTPWQNPQYNPDRNKDGYTRYDHTQRGSGLNLSKTFADGARVYDVYNKLQSGQPGFTHGENARKQLAAMGGTAANASDEQKFDAIDLAHRGAQFKNQRPKRKFTLGKLLTEAAPAIIGVATGNPWLGAAAAGTKTAAKGGSFADILKDSAISYASGAIGGKLWGSATAPGTTEAARTANALRASKAGYI